MSTAQSTVRNLISESQEHDTIVEAEHTPELEAALLAYCDDHTDIDGDVVEFWGDEGPQSEIDGSVDEAPWRVHLTRSAAEAQSESSDRIDPMTLLDLANDAADAWSATVIVRNDRGNGSAGPVALLIAEIIEWRSDDDLTEVTADEDPEAWRLAREAHDDLKLEPPCQVWVGDTGDGSNPPQAIYSV